MSSNCNNNLPTTFDQQATTQSQQLFKWLFFTILLPFVIPYVIVKSIRSYQWNRRKGVSLKGKVVLITGASSGLGESLSHEFYKSGCRVILAARRTEELERVKEELLQLNLPDPICPPVVFPLDLEDLTTLPQKGAAILNIYGHVDILVNNGGMSYRGEIVDTALDVDLKLMVVNYFGQVALTKALLPSMIERKEGHIIAVSSVQGKIAIPFRSAYSASKHALQAFCDSLRSEVKQHNIKVTVVSPGYIQTKLSLNAITGTGDQYGVMDKSTSSGYKPSEVAQQMIKSVVLEDNDSIIASIGPRIAILLRNFIPPLYFWIMQFRVPKKEVIKPSAETNNFKKFD